jgi:transposase
MALFWLSDEAWAAIEPHLPRNQPGARRFDDRRVIYVERRDGNMLGLRSTLAIAPIRRALAVLE